MTPAERHARFQAVVARAMAKPPEELPYRAPTRTRFHYAEEAAPSTGLPARWSSMRRGTAALVRLNTGRTTPHAQRRS